MKKLILSFIILLTINFSFAQHIEKLDHCDCVNKIDQLTPSLNGNFERQCKGVTTLKGEFVNGKMNGEWLTYSKSGKLIRTLKYNNGILDGDFELFFINGKKKLTAHFENGKKVGKWTYYGMSGNSFIEGNYENNKPVGVWTIKDIEGKNIAVQYDYDAKKYLVNKPAVYYNDGDMLFNENTEEWYILHKPESDHKITVPLGGMELAVFIFIKSVEIPETIFNTYLHNKYKMSLNISSESEMNFTQTTVDGDCPKDQENLLFAINTNEPSMIKKVTISDIESELIDMKINEAMHILPPWVSSQDMNGDVYVHYIINKNLHRL